MIRVWKILARINILFFFFAASSCVTREIPNSISAPTIAPAPTARVSLSPTATRAASSLPPSWWTLEIEMPATIEFSGDKNTAVWSTRDLNVKGLSDLLAAQGKNARYAVSIIARSVDAIYDVVFVKNGNAYGLNLTRGIARTVITGTRVGMIHLRVTGAVNLEMDLPMRERLDTRAGSEIFIGTAIPNEQCERCENFLNLHIAPFKGAATYTSKARGDYLIDAWIIPGGDPEKDDYRYAQECTIVVNVASSGSFDCRGLVNIRDDFKHIDIRGTWQQPVLP